MTAFNTRPMFRVNPRIVTLSYGALGAPLSGIVDDILADAESRGYGRWWEMPGLEAFAPPNVADLYANAWKDPAGYLRMLDEVNRYGNRGGNYYVGNPIPSFDAFVGGGAWVTQGTKNQAWRELWGLNEYRVYAPTNIGVVYTQLRAQEAADAAAARNATSAAIEAARKQAALESGDIALNYQGGAGREALEKASEDAKSHDIFGCWTPNCDSGNPACDIPCQIYKNLNSLGSTVKTVVLGSAALAALYLISRIVRR